jgi:predicted transcriptional regulator
MKELTKAEEQVMQALWKIEQGFAKEIVETVEGNHAYNTILTVLRILVDKGFVDYEKFGKAFRYFPVHSKEEYSQFRIKNLKNNYFEGSYQKLLSFLLKKEDIDLKDLEKILKDNS